MENVTSEATVVQKIQECLRYLAGVCDYAESRDNQGFKACDTKTGHYLAAKEELELGELLFAAEMIRIYRKTQLELRGLVVPELDEVKSYVGNHKVEEFTRKTLKERERAKREQEWVAREEEKREASSREREAEAEANKPKSLVYVQSGRIVVEYGYGVDRFSEKLKAMQSLKVIKGKTPSESWAFNKFFKKEWSFPKSALPQILEALKPFDDFEYGAGLEELRIEAEAEAEVERQRREIERQAREAEQEAAFKAVEPYLNGEPLPSGRTLFKHQKDAIRTMIEEQHALLAHDMGLGKTMEMLVTASAYDLPILVVCPATLRINWLREAEMVGVPIEVYSWAKIPPPPETGYVLLADEAHYAMNLRSQRTQAFLELAENARIVLPGSGTPMPNGRPANLWPLLVAIRHPITEMGKRAFEIRYCNGHKKVVNRQGLEVWDNTGATHLDELHKKLGRKVLYLKKEQCLDLPEKMRVMRGAEPSPAEEEAYSELITALRESHKGKISAKRAALLEEQKRDIERAIEEGTPVEDLDLDDIPNGDEADALVELGILRYAGSKIKIGSALEIAHEVLEQKGQIVLFTAYRDTAEYLAQELECRCLRGGLSVEAKQEMVDRFQRGEDRAFVCTIGAGGVGITLTAAQTVVLVDRPWRPGDAEQCEDRLHRISQTGAVTAIWLQYGEVDQKVDQLLVEKQDRIDLVLEGKRKTMRGVSQSVRALAKQVMSEIYADR